MLGFRRHCPTKQHFHGFHGTRSGVLASTSLLLLAAAAFLFKISSEPSSQSDLLVDDRKQTSPPSSSSVVAIRPLMESYNGTELISQIPASPKAVLFIAHGCHGRAGNFWESSPACPGCVGLPEERIVALRAFDRGFAVLVVSSAGKCWSLGEEKQRVARIIERWVTKNELRRLPIIALGASSGGFFVSALAARIKFSSVVLMIAEGVFDKMPVRKDYPPTLFVHMPKDSKRAKAIETNLKMLREKGVDAAEVRCLAFPVKPEKLAEKIPGLGSQTSMKLFEVLREEGFVDKEGYMKKDGRATPWNEAFVKKLPSMARNPWLHHVQEELNLAFGFHEMTSLQMDQILGWFESHM